MDWIKEDDEGDIPPRSREDWWRLWLGRAFKGAIVYSNDGANDFGHLV